jgi:hypothetical protein
MITDVAFLGDHLRLEVDVFGGEAWQVRVGVGALNADGGVLRVGEMIGLHWRADDAHLVAP